MKNIGFIFFIITVAVGGLLIYLFKDKIFPDKKTEKQNDKAPDVIPIGKKDTPAKDVVNDNSDPIPTPTALDKNKLLKRGVKGAEVERLQEMINKALAGLGKKLLVTDGAFGPKTEEALYYLIKTRTTTLAQFATKIIDKIKK